VEAVRVADRESALVALSTPVPGAPDVALATDSPVFSPAQIAELCADLDAIEAARGEWSLATRTARAGTRRR
jgi:hypothetical protein